MRKLILSSSSLSEVVDQILASLPPSNSIFIPFHPFAGLVFFSFLLINLMLLSKLLRNGKRM
jgi:hypothetical protein